MSCVELKQILDPKNLHTACFSHSSAATENGKRFELNNRTNAGICKVRVDGCLIADNAVRKCDFFFEVRGAAKSYFLVELKGGDLNSAVRQIESTYDLLNEKLRVPVENFTGVIVASAVPGTANLTFRTLQERLLRSKGLHLKRSTGQHVVRV